MTLPVCGRVEDFCFSGPRACSGGRRVDRERGVSSPDRLESHHGLRPCRPKSQDLHHPYTCTIHVLVLNPLDLLQSIHDVTSSNNVSGPSRRRARKSPTFDSLTRRSWADQSNSCQKGRARAFAVSLEPLMLLRTRAERAASAHRAMSRPRAAASSADLSFSPHERLEQNNPRRLPAARPESAKDMKR